jgi:hypothetical protein
MSAPRKRLIHFIQDRTFLARRHAHLLDEQSLSEYQHPELRELQACYRASTDEVDRRAIALRFQQIVKATPEQRRERQLMELLGGGLAGLEAATVRIVYDDRRRGAWELRVPRKQADELRRGADRIDR